MVTIFSSNLGSRGHESSVHPSEQQTSIESAHMCKFPFVIDTSVLSRVCLSCCLCIYDTECVCVCVYQVTICLRFPCFYEGKAKGWGSGGDTEACSGVVGRWKVFNGFVLFHKRRRDLEVNNKQESSDKDEGHPTASVKILDRFCLALLSCSHSPKTSLRSVCVIHEAEVSFRPYVLAEEFLQTRTRPHIHELVFSLCPYAVSGVALLPTNWPFHRSPNKSEAAPSGRSSPLINYTHPSHT